MTEDQTIEKILHRWNARFKIESGWQTKVIQPIAIELVEPGGSFFLLLTPGSPPKAELAKTSPDCQVRMKLDQSLFLDIVSGRKNPQSLWMEEKISLHDTEGALLALTELFDDSPAHS